MTRRLLNNIGTETIDLGEGDWVRIKARFTMGDRAAIAQSMMTGGMRSHEEVDPDTGERKSVSEMGQLNFGNSNIATLSRAIVAWGGPGFCVIDHDEPGAPDHHDGDDPEGRCRSSALTESNLRVLDEEFGSPILERISQRNPKPSTEVTALP